MSREVILEIRLRIAQRHAVILENRVDLKPRFEAKQALDLILGQSAGTIALDCKRFESLPGKIRPSALESF